MNFDMIARDLQLGAAHDVWRERFELSQASYAPDRLWMRDAGAFADTCRRAGFSDEVIGVLLDALPSLLAHEPVLRLMWHCHHHLFVLDPRNEGELGNWPMLPETAGDLGRLFYAFVYLSGLPRVLALHERKRIPLQITQATLPDLERWMREYRDRTGRWGLDQRWWPSTYFTGKLYALGRLQFEMAPFGMPFRVFRSNRDGRVVSLAEPGLQIGAHGQFANAFGGRNAGDVWTTTLTEEADRLTGHPATELGELQRDRTITLDRSQWSLVLRSDTPALSVHIPATGPLTDSACDAAFAQAETFFPRHFPEYRPRAFSTVSWLLDPQLTRYLPAESNVVKFLRRFHLLPFPGTSDYQTRERLFGTDLDKPLDHLPQTTTLQRAFVHHVRNGGAWRMTGGFILTPE